MVIGLGHKLGVGKDTVGRIIQILTGYKEASNGEIIYYLDNWGDKEWRVSDSTDFTIQKFADPIKDMVCTLLDCTREDLESGEFKNTELGEEWWYYKSNINYGVDLGYTTDFEFIKNQLISYSDSQRYIEVISKLDDNPKFKGKYSLDLIKMTPRLLMELLGTSCGREIIHPNIWCLSTFKDYKINHIDKDFLDMNIEEAKILGLIE